MKSFLCKVLHAWRARLNRSAAEKVKAALTFVNDDIPCFIVCYNNPSHVALMVEQLNQRGLTPIIFDNQSSCADTQSLLASLHRDKAYVIHVEKNLRHKVGFLPGIYEQMPTVFAYTDPDLQFAPKLPNDFLTTLEGLTNEYSVFKAGPALVLDAGEIPAHLNFKMKKCGSIPFEKHYTVKEWESNYWKFPLKRDDALEVYAAPLDTTFAVYNKANFTGKFMTAVRVAGDFKVIHLPWFPELDNMSATERERYLGNNKSTTWVSK